MPDTGFHSVILRPDSVRRVTPPTTMTAKTRAEERSSQRATGGGESMGRLFSGSDGSADEGAAAAPVEEKGDWTSREIDDGL